MIINSTIFSSVTCDPQIAIVSGINNFGHCLVIHDQHQSTKWDIHHVNKHHGPPGPHHGVLGLIKGYLCQAGTSGGQKGPTTLTSGAVSVSASEVEAKVDSRVWNSRKTVSEAYFL